MLVNDRTTQKRTIKSHIENNGWKVFQIDNYEWWENEVWKIESVWTPIGKKAFIIFENDPMDYDDEVLEAWAVIASPIRPTNRSGESSDFQMSLNNKWEKELPKLIDYLSIIRNG